MPVSLRCFHCKIPISRSPYKARTNKRHFCSKACRGQWQSINENGVSSPSYKNGGTVYRQIALRHYGIKCQSCGYSKDERLIEVHHKDGNRQNNDVTNLAVLCFWCHKCITRGVPVHSQHERVINES